MKNGFIAIGLVATLMIAGCSKEPVPESFGFYVVSAGDLVPMEAAEKIGQAGEMGKTILGLRSRPTTKSSDSGSYFILFQQDSGRRVEELELSRLGFESNRLFKGTFSEKNLKLNMFTHRYGVDFDVIPMDEAGRMFKLVPRTPLVPGVYAFHSGGLQKPGLVTSKPTIHAFEIEGPTQLDAGAGFEIEAWPKAEMAVLYIPEDKDRLAAVELGRRGDALVTGRQGDKSQLIIADVPEDDTGFSRSIVEGLQPRFGDVFIMSSIRVQAPTWNAVPISGVWIELGFREGYEPAALEALVTQLTDLQGCAPWILLMGDQIFTLIVEFDHEAVLDQIRSIEEFKTFELQRLETWFAASPRMDGAGAEGG